MARVTIRVEGIEALQRKLKRAPDVVRAHAASAVAASTVAVAQRARALVPVGATGLLRRSIESSVVNGVGRVGISSAAAYWRYVEFGTRYVAARPFIRPAAEGEAPAYLQRMRDIGPKIERDLST